MNSIESKIRETIIKHNLLKSQSVEKIEGKEAIEYGYCLFKVPEYPDKYFVISKVDIYAGDSLDKVALNAYVFDGNGDELEFDLSEVNLNEIIKKGEKLCEIV